MLPTRQLRGTTSTLAYLVLLRVEIARFTRTESARLCCSDPHLRAFSSTPWRTLKACRWRGVTSYAVLCSPDVPPVRPFGVCTSDGLARFTGELSPERGSPHAPPHRGFLPPEGADSPRGGPAVNPLPPRSTAARVAAPRGGRACLGEPGGGPGGSGLRRPFQTRRSIFWCFHTSL
jgi:hypothetical protein